MWEMFMNPLMMMLMEEESDGGGGGGTSEGGDGAGGTGGEGESSNEGKGESGKGGGKETPPEGKEGEGSGKEGEGGKSSKEEVEPPSYELALEKDSLLTETDLQSVSKYAKENKLSEKDAKELLEIQEDAVGTRLEKLETDHKEKIASWKKEIESRKGFEEEKVLVAQARDKFASPELKEMLDKSGYSNLAPLWDLFKSVGEAMKDDNFEKGPPGNPGAKGGEEKSLGQRLYGNSKK